MDYMDAWRFLNEEKRGFTWKRLNPEKKQARLDYFLISSDMFFFLHECEIVPGYRTDHSGNKTTKYARSIIIYRL